MGRFKIFEKKFYRANPLLFRLLKTANQNTGNDDKERSTHTLSQDEEN